MQTERVLTAADGTVASPSIASDLVAMAKPTISAMSALTAGIGFALAGGAASVALPLILGTVLMAASANAFNMVLEIDLDANMRRTRTRPLPAGRLSPAAGTVFATTIGVGGLIVLSLVNMSAAAMGGAALILYVAGYTPMKRLSPWSLHVGAVAGALPVLIGWFGAGGGLTIGALVLFAILYVWQMPHFLTIGVFRVRDYADAGFRTVAVVHGPERAARDAVAYTVVLAVLGPIPALVGLAGGAYLATMLLLGVWLVLIAVRYDRAKVQAWARKLFLATLGFPVFWAAALALDLVI